MGGAALFGFFDTLREWVKVLPAVKAVVPRHADQHDALPGDPGGGGGCAAPREASKPY